MLTHVTLGCNDLEKARAFYDAVLAPLGMKRLMDGDIYSMWGIDRPMVIVRHPLDGKPATHANGGTVGFSPATPRLTLFMPRVWPMAAHRKVPPAPARPQAD